ncbi:MAG: DUF3089 domain-containing protein, partial [Halioglobus sp.]|nr:DUF3089 domain-containing protein [Halioglobus sp.]
ILLGVVAIIAIGLLGLVVTGNGRIIKLAWDFNFAAPDLPFDPADAVAAPDYAEERNWGGLAHRDDLADMVPVGMQPEVVQGQAPVDVFYVHPTGFLKGTSWTFSMDPDTSTEENTKWMIANQASAYNSCCNVYAPRYRQASIFTYFSVDEATRDEILGFAYQDVARAFDYFIEHYNEGRPFIIASHSQGTHHNLKLLQEKIDGTPLAGRMVAAYLVGGGLKKENFADMETISLCDSPDQLGCAIHWDTYSMALLEDAEETGGACTNPLTWRLDGPRAAQEQHVGAVRSAGEYHLQLSGDDAARGVDFSSMGAPIPNYLEAQCEGGRLYVTDQSGTPFGEAGDFGGTYHGLDYPLFYMDLRENAKLRAAKFLANWSGVAK